MKKPYDKFFYGNKEKYIDDNHHLFSYKQIRRELVRVCGEPTTDEEHKLLHRTIKRIHRKMPRFVINKKQHIELHIRDNDWDDKELTKQYEVGNEKNKNDSRK